MLNAEHMFRSEWLSMRSRTLEQAFMIYLLVDIMVSMCVISNAVDRKAAIIALEFHFRLHVSERNFYYIPALKLMWLSIFHRKTAI